MFDRIKAGTLLGRVVRWVIRFEVQDRGSLHVHMCLWMSNDAEADRIGSEICAHIPAAYNPETQQFHVPDANVDPVGRRLYFLVQNKQMHACCTRGRPKPCRPEGHDRPQCKRGFPHNIKTDTIPHIDPTTGRYVYYCPRECDRHVVPYHPRLLLYADAHVNLQRVVQEQWSFYMM